MNKENHAIRIGHVNLKVSDLESAIAFYTDVMGLTLMQRFGTGGAFLGYGGYHHHIGLNTLSSEGGAPPPESCTGLHHVAFLYPDRDALIAAVQRVITHLKDVGSDEVPQVRDHGVSEAVYYHDPDNILIEMYCDRPTEAWPYDSAGNLAMFNEQVDLETFLNS